jgi:hypothetical protein
MRTVRKTWLDVGAMTRQSALSCSWAREWRRRRRSAWRRYRRGAEASTLPLPTALAAIWRVLAVVGAVATGVLVVRPTARVPREFSAILLSGTAAIPSIVFIACLWPALHAPGSAFRFLAHVKNYWVVVGAVLLLSSFALLPFQARRLRVEIARACHVLLWAVLTFLTLVTFAMDGPTP